MRELNIINDLIESKDYLSLEYFINKYSISKRTLQNEFSYISNISKKRGFHLIEKRGSGYLLEVLDEKKFLEFRNELIKLSEEPKVSAENIIAYLSFREEYESIENLIQIFKSSKSTFKGFKKEMDEYLENFNLKMERKTHYGLRIEEKLKLRRDLLIHLYSNENEFVINEIDFYIDERFKMVQKCLIDTLKEKEVIINYIELTQLVTWLKVVIYINLKEKTSLNEDKDIQIIKKINKQFEVGVKSEDVEEFESLIKRKSRTVKKDEEFLEELGSILSEFLKEIDEENKTSFNKDENFKHLLLTHVVALVNRLRKNVSYKNPIIDEISIKYPMVFNIVIALSNRLKEKYNVVATRDEIGFITIYFILHMEKEVLDKLKNYKKIAIVCASGEGSSYLIKLKLESLFTKACIETFSVLQIENLEEYKPDIIFSITDLILKIDTPVVYIKELLSDLDILNIKQLVMFEKFDKVAAGKTEEYLVRNISDIGIL
ncbi:MAG: BglG family transcription antiterminator [Clostridium sp.]|uniref:BglG family transcription antiterminator n=1 Tax=Clostridium sp. TaxID=1506 RepID=UPI003EE5C8B0